MTLPRLRMSRRHPHRPFYQRRRLILSAILASLTIYWFYLISSRTFGCPAVLVPLLVVSPPLPGLHAPRRSSSASASSRSVVSNLCHACLNSTACALQLPQAVFANTVSWESRLSDLWQAAKACSCNTCQPNTPEQQYWNPDAAGPHELYSKSHSHLLQAIPPQYRLPNEAISNLGAYFTTHPSFPQQIFLFAYNPTVVVLPRSQKTHPDAVYLASHRVTAFQYCFKDKFAKHVFNLQDPYPTDVAPPLEGLVSLAILRQDLSILQEIVVDTRSVFPKMQDPRLFVLQGQIYVASYEYIVPLWLRQPTTTKTTTTTSSVLLRDYWNDTTEENDSMRVYVRSQPSCCTSPTCQGGKNFNYFVDQDGNTWVETNPMQPRIIEQVDVTRPCSTGGGGGGSGSGGGGGEQQQQQQQQQQYSKQLTVYQHPGPPPRLTFYSTDALLTRLAPNAFSEERGTACCLTLSHPTTGQKLRVGISHAKSKRLEGWQHILTGRQYASKFYAFAAEPPFGLVAVSGSFCLGFGEEHDLENVVARKQPYRLGGELACPKITFPSGLVDLSADYGLLSYGINDCSGRMIVVDKKEISAMLWNPESRLTS